MKTVSTWLQRPVVMKSNCGICESWRMLKRWQCQIHSKFVTFNLTNQVSFEFQTSFSATFDYPKIIWSKSTLRNESFRSVLSSRFVFPNFRLSENYFIESRFIEMYHLNSGQYLSVAGNDVRIFRIKEWNEVVRHSAHTDDVTCSRWGHMARKITTCSMDRTVKVFSL